MLKPDDDPEMPEVTQELFELSDKIVMPKGYDFDTVEAEAKEVLDRLAEGWVRHRQHGLAVAAVLHRASFALCHRPDPLVNETPDFARALPRADRAPHALLTLRSVGLGYSKTNSYTSAWLAFAELRSRLAAFRSSQPNASGILTQMFDEVAEQDFLAETGTAACVAEFDLLSWARTFGQAEKPLTPVMYRREERLRFHAAYDVLSRGIRSGSEATDLVQGLRLDLPRGLDHIAAASWRRRPAIMTARCHLLLIPLCRIMEDFGTKRPQWADTWSEEIEVHRQQFAVHYGDAESVHLGVPFDENHQREVVQLRLHYALLFPGSELLTTSDDPALSASVPDIPALADWLRAGNHNANLAASISAPRYLSMMRPDETSKAVVDWILDSEQDSLRRGDAKPVFSENRQWIADQIAELRDAA